MATDEWNAVLPTEQEIVEILTTPAAPELFPIGDCEEKEFRELLATSVNLPWGDRAAIISNPSRVVRQHLPKLVQRMRAEQKRLRIRLPKDWAATHYNLGVAYCHRLTGDRGWNVTEAIKHFKAALGVYTGKEFPVEWAMAQNGLGEAYLYLQVGKMAENVCRAIGRFESSLKILTRENFPVEWSMTQNNLGNAYLHHLDGDLAHVWELRLQLVLWQGVEN